MLSSVRAIARRALVGASAAALVLSALPAAVTAEDVVPSPTAVYTLDELVELNRQAWNNNDMDLLREVYAPDAVHTTTYYDRSEEFEGVDRIASVALNNMQVERVGPRIEIPAEPGAYRWADFADIGGGTACLWKAVDGKITRHDCVLPETVQGVTKLFPAAEGGSTLTVEELSELSQQAWNENDEALFEQTWAPDAIHIARYLNTTKRYEGRDEVAKIALGPGNVENIGPIVELEAPDGELAWASVATIAGGTVCIFRARDGQIVRHSCALPISG